jgi:hypothetical protein
MDVVVTSSAEPPEALGERLVGRLCRFACDAPTRGARRLGAMLRVYPFSRQIQSDW